VLKGPFATAECLFERIPRDFRRSGAIVRENAPQDERLFGHWFMARAGQASDGRSGEGPHLARASAAQSSLGASGS
jgi:hypothetical protein